MDETCIGGKETDNHSDKKRRAGRGSVEKQAVLGVRDRATGKVKALPVNSEEMACVRSELTAGVEPGARVYTDERRAYSNRAESCRGKDRRP